VNNGQIISLLERYSSRKTFGLSNRGGSNRKTLGVSTRDDVAPTPYDPIEAVEYSI
jgi:hypothetical protein